MERMSDTAAWICEYSCVTASSTEPSRLGHDDSISIGASSPQSAAWIASVTCGITGCAMRSIEFSTCEASAVAAARSAASSLLRRGLIDSRYQSQYSLQMNE